MGSDLEPLSTSIGADGAGDCAGDGATCEASGECVPRAKEPAGGRAAVLEAAVMGECTVAPGGYDNRAASPIAGAKEGTVGIPPVTGGGGH